MTDERIDYYNKTYKDILTSNEIKWLIFYEQQTGFEPIVDPELNFSEVIGHNLHWFKSWCEESIEKIENYERELFGEYSSYSY